MTQPSLLIPADEQSGELPSLTYDIVLLPNPQLAKKAIDISQQLANTYPTRFTLDETTVPHYSIYMAQLDEKEVEEAKKIIKDIASRFASFELKVTQYWQDPIEGFFEIQYERTPALIELQKNIINQINPLRHGRFLKNYPPGYTKEELVSQLTGNALEQLKKYGYPEIGEDYRPHMTFTRLTPDALDTVISAPLQIEGLSGDFPTLGIFAMGRNGTCVQEIAVSPFLF